MIDYITAMWQLAQNGEKQGVLFFVVAYVAIVMSYSFVRQYLASQWPCVKGQLIDSGLKKFGAENSLSDQDYRVNSVYEYEVDGKKYQGKRVSPWVIVASHNARGILKQQLKGIQHNLDGTVNVYYNPKKPQKAF